MAQAIMPGGQWQSLGIYLAIGLHPANLAISLSHRSLPKLYPHLNKIAPDSWKAFIAYQERRVWEKDPPAQKPTRVPPHRRAEVLAWLAKAAPLEFVADFHSVAYRPMSPAQKKQPLPRPLKEELDYQAALHDMSWKRRDDSIYLFRNNR